MTYGRRQDAYREAAILGSTPEQLVPLLYEHLLVALKRASTQIQAQDIEGKSVSLQKAFDIVFELLGALDFEKGGEIASRLASLYAYFTREISEINRTLDTARLEQLIKLVTPLHESWVEAARVVDSGAATALTEGPPAG